MNFTEDQILALAPDDASKKSGKEQANPSKWSNTGIDEKSLWGECQGSGKNPYRTQVDLANIAFKCSCPSRKFPCKHGLGVLLLYCRERSLFAAKDSPAWVKEWMDKREEKAEKKQEKTDKPVDVEAQAKRQQQRLKKIDNGVEELQLLINDIVRNGILNMPEKGPALFTNLTKRMIDAQAQGLAGMVRELAEMNYFKENWQNSFMDQLLRIYITITAFKNKETLNDNLSGEIKNLIGFTQSPEELKQQEGLNDNWFVLGKQTVQQEQLFVQRNWLLGINSGQYALVLQFYVRSQLPELNLIPGSVVEAELSFYRSICPYRAIIKNTDKTISPKQITGFDNWNSLMKFEKEKYIRSPFIFELPFFINTVSLARLENKWFLNDVNNVSVPIVCDENKLHALLAVSGGKNFSATLIGCEGVYEPIGIFINNNYFIL
ncbi:MAG: SWIM zinc finger family protein [Bacteroidia bacterium]|nr:SWIM zinc finger family protein [Bacteroidia bacterium]